MLQQALVFIRRSTPILLYLFQTVSFSFRFLSLLLPYHFSLRLPPLRRAANRVGNSRYTAFNSPATGIPIAVIGQ
ncbi:MAG: hypothetical protein HY080_02970 [Gammaproteobacteria bacterium]|nr:hypothetical protein [Gammaproteobacteria bacterium]